MTASTGSGGQRGNRAPAGIWRVCGEILRWLFALIVATAAGLAMFALFTFDADSRPGVRWGVPAGVALGALLAVGLLLMWLTRRGRPLPRGYPWLALLPGLAAGIGVGLFCPMNKIPIPEPTLQSLEIIATPEHDPNSNGNEVWVEAIVLPGGEHVPVDTLDLDGDWEVRDGIPISYQRKPATLRFSDKLRGGVDVRLACGEWSGIVEIVWNGKRRTVNLYAPEPGVRTQSLERNPADRDRFADYFLAVRIAFALLAAAAALLLDLVLCVRRPRPHAVDTLPWTWQRLAGTVGVVAVGLVLASYTNEFSREAYLGALVDRNVGMVHNLAQARGYRDFLAAHVPPGELIFSDRITSRWLPAHYDCYILAPHIGANILIADPQRRVDLGYLLAEDTPWPARRALLDKYGVTWALINRWRLEQFGWVLEHAAESWEQGDYILVRLQLAPVSTVDEATSRPHAHREPA